MKNLSPFPVVGLPRANCCLLLLRIRDDTRAGRLVCVKQLGCSKRLVCGRRWACIKRFVFDKPFDCYKPLVCCKFKTHQPVLKILVQAGTSKKKWHLILLAGVRGRWLFQGRCGRVQSRVWSRVRQRAEPGLE